LESAVIRPLHLQQAIPNDPKPRQSVAFASGTAAAPARPQMGRGRQAQQRMPFSHIASTWNALAQLAFERLSKARSGRLRNGSRIESLPWAPRSRHLPHDTLQTFTNAGAETIKGQLLEHAPNEFVVGAQKAV
jgi:hypothetical protein